MCLFARGGLAVSAFSVLCSRSSRPFCSGWPGSIRSGTMPSLTHHTASDDRLPNPTLAKGGPLSVRMARGSPYSRKARSRTRCACGPLGLDSPSQANRYREGGVLHGQRVDPDTISCAEPPLPVDGPDVVGALGSSEGFAPGRSMPASFSPLHQPCPFQDIPGGAGRRPRLLWFQRSQPCHQLLGSPGRISKPGSDQPLSNSLRGPIGTATRSSTAVPQSIPAPLLKPPHSLIAGLATDAELTAQLHEAHSPLLPSLDKVDLLGFRPLLFPGQHIPPDGIAPIFAKCVTHVPGLSVTNVPGLYPPQSSPRGGGGGIFPSPCGGFAPKEDNLVSFALRQAQGERDFKPTLMVSLSNHETGSRLLVQAPLWGKVRPVLSLAEGKGGSHPTDPTCG